MSDPGTILDQIATDTNDLDRLSKAIYKATARLDAAEQAWDEKYDAVMADLESEFAEAGRKSVPEHTAVSAARRAHRAEYVEYREAARAVERMQRQLQAKRAALNGRQSELGALRDELRASGIAEPQATHTYGGRRAA
jgi:chromosome segregation ATPase